MKRALILLILFPLFFSFGCNVPSKEVKVYFFKDSRLSAVSRTIPTIEDPLMIAISALMEGPSASERAEGYTTEIPAGTQARRVGREGNVAIIDFNSNLGRYEGGGARVRGLLAQIVYTASGVRGIKLALIKLQGQDYFELGSEGYVVDHPLERRDVRF